MELKDFIQETLCQITDGIIQSQTVLKDKGALVAPEGYQFNGRGTVGNDFAVVEEVNFEIAIGATSQNNSKGGLKTPIIEVVLGKSSKDEANNKVSFSVPLVYPRMKTDDFHSY